MAETAGLVLGVAGLAGLFTTCIDCYQLVRRGQARDRDYKILETKFNNQELRLSTWGRACGLLQSDEYDERLDEPVLNSRIAATLECIGELFQDEKKLKKRFGLKPLGAVSGIFARADRNALAMQPAADVSIAPASRRTALFFWKKQQSSLSRFRDGARWAIADRDKFTELVQHLKDFNDDLEAMTRPLDGWYARQRRIVQMEIEEIPDMETLEDIAAASHDDADLISDTVSLRIKSIRTGSSILTAPAPSGTTKSFFTALTSVPATIDEVVEEDVAQVDIPLRRTPVQPSFK